VGNQVEVWNDAIAKPVAVRYAWATFPLCNLFSKDGLPVCPFRTDDYSMPILRADKKAKK
jgi:sialate O-acetylesterase